MQVVYCYLMNGPQEQIIEAAPQHAAYWRSLDLARCVPGGHGPHRRLAR
jgi:hypothetical protein